MYTHNGTAHDSLQPVVSNSFVNHTTDCKDEDEIDGLTSLDPMGERIWSIVSDLLKNKSEITIQDIFEVSDIKESPIRTRLNLLVKLKHLSCINGTGRRPTYYFLPHANNEVEPASPEYVIRSLEKQLAWKKQEKERLQERLLVISSDEEAIQRTIKILLDGGNHE